MTIYHQNIFDNDAKTSCLSKILLIKNPTEKLWHFNQKRHPTSLNGLYKFYPAERQRERWFNWKLVLISIYFDGIWSCEGQMNTLLIPLATQAMHSALRWSGAGTMLKGRNAFTAQHQPYCQNPHVGKLIKTLFKISQPDRNTKVVTSFDRIGIACQSKILLIG